jgi:small subunit ribosomal protein S17e
MGRIKTQMIKRLTLQLVKQHKPLFSTDFVANKKLVEQLLTDPSKKIRNTVAGYVTRIMQRKEE